MNAFPDFAGHSLTVNILGEGVAIDPAAGMVSIPTDGSGDGREVIITAGNSGDSATSTFWVKARAVPPDPVVAPLLLAAPVLAGPGVIGAEHTVDPGLWEGATGLARQWRRDGVDIPGAIEGIYVPVAADDMADLACRIIATNAAGSTPAETSELRVTQAAPVAAGALANLTRVLHSGVAVVAAAEAFAGAALSYAVSGAQAWIDAVSGLVSIPTDALVAGDTVTVTATNSGGAAAVAFRVTVAMLDDAVIAPAVAGTIPDLRFAQDSGARTISTQAHFAGTDLVYALDAAPEGVTIQAGSGLVSLPTAALLSAARITVRASNAAGSVTQSFAVTVHATRSVFDAAAKLGETSFVFETGAPSWTQNGTIFARLVPATTGRLHGDWRLAGGDGLYRCLVRWNASNTGANGASPFVFGARIAKNGADLTGFYVEVSRLSGSSRQLRLRQYTGSGILTTLLGSVASDWIWYEWYWVEVEILGTSVKARLYPEASAAPDWQLSASTTHTGAGGFGPSAFPINGVGPTLDIKRLEFVFQAAAGMPAAALDGEWELGQITVRK